jgi:hypothetical protein
MIMARTHYILTDNTAADNLVLEEFASDQTLGATSYKT